MGLKLARLQYKSREVGLIDIPYEENTSGYYVLENSKLTRTDSSSNAYSQFNVGRTVYESKLHYLKNAPVEIIDKRNLHLKEPKVIHSYKISRYLDHFENQIENKVRFQLLCLHL